MIAFEAASTQPGGIRRNLATLFVCTEAGMPVDAELGGLESQLDGRVLVVVGVPGMVKGVVELAGVRAAQGGAQGCASLHVGLGREGLARAAKCIERNGHSVDCCGRHRCHLSFSREFFREHIQSDTDAHSLSRAGSTPVDNSRRKDALCITTVRPTSRMLVP